LIHALLTDPAMQRARGRPARIFGASPLSKRGSDSFRGVLGEFAVGRMLSRLDSRWFVMHAVPVGRRGADIDHLVVGPAGVFTVNTKNHSGQKVWVAGQNLRVAGVPCNHIRNSEFEAGRAVKLLSKAVGRPVSVRPVIAVLNPQQLDIKSPPTGVDVLRAQGLVRWLRKRPTVLGAEEVARIVSVIGVPATWDQVADGSKDLDRRQEFEALRASIRFAKNLKRLWAFVLVAMVLLAVVLAWPEFHRLTTDFVTNLLQPSA
jgi:Nuclease-related domain